MLSNREPGKERKIKSKRPWRNRKLALRSWKLNSPKPEGRRRKLKCKRSMVKSASASIRTKLERKSQLTRRLLKKKKRQYSI